MMIILTYIMYSAIAIAILASAMVITRLNAVHALLYLIIALQAIAVVFFLSGAPFIAALEVIVYAGAIMVLFIFVIMMLNLGPHAVTEERQWFSPRMLVGPAALALVLLGEMVYGLQALAGAETVATEITPRQVSASLYGPYMLCVELASFLLLAGLVAAYHLGRRITRERMPGVG